ncbi:unnamed protein product, partial [Didymodactylos carnosus]
LIENFNCLQFVPPFDSCHDQNENALDQSPSQMKHNGRSRKRKCFLDDEEQQQSNRVDTDEQTHSYSKMIIEVREYRALTS